jgi:hypothetical protein
MSKITLWSPCRFFKTYRPTTVAVRKYENVTILRCCAFSNGKYLLTFLKQDDPLKCRWIFTCRNGVISQKIFAEDLFAAKQLWYIQSPQHNNPQMDVDYFALAFIQYWKHWSVFRLQLFNRNDIRSSDLCINYCATKHFNSNYVSSSFKEWITSGMQGEN